MGYWHLSLPRSTRLSNWFKVFPSFSQAQGQISIGCYHRLGLCIQKLYLEKVSIWIHYCPSATAPFSPFIVPSEIFFSSLNLVLVHKPGSALQYRVWGRRCAPPLFSLQAECIYVVWAHVCIMLSKLFHVDTGDQTQVLIHTASILSTKHKCSLFSISLTLYCF